MMSEDDNNLCNLGNCRYNENGCCTNLLKREECIYVSERVLCVDNVDTRWCEKN